MKRNWNLHLLACQYRGIRDFAAGVAKDQCPYKTGHRGINGPGGNLQRQRRNYWRNGWEIASYEATSKKLQGQN